MSDLFDLSGEVVLVTGASQGLGRRFARVLTQHGAAVALAARQTDKLTHLRDELVNAGGRAFVVPLDVTKVGSFPAALDSVETALGALTVVVNNAGIAVDKPALAQTEADWDAVLGANLKGAYFLATEAARRWIARQQTGNVINIASVLGIGALKNVSPYMASKGGMIQATRALALEWADKGVRVNAIAPGYIDTDMNHEFWATPAGERLIKRIPQKRVGDDSDLDGAILLLASKASRYMTGSVVTVDGGFLLG